MKDMTAQVRNLNKIQCKECGVLKLNQSYLQTFKFLTEPDWVKIDLSVISLSQDEIICGQWKSKVNTGTHEYTMLFTIKREIDVTVGELLDVGYDFEIEVRNNWHDSSLTEADLRLRPMLIKRPIYMYENSKNNDIEDPLDTQKRFERVILIAKNSYELLFKEIGKGTIDFPWLPS